MVRLLFVFCVLLLASGPAAAAAGGQDTRATRADGHVVLAWLHGGSSEEYRAHVEQMTGVTVVAPTWWRLDHTDPGGIEEHGDPEFAAWAQERGLAVWPLLGNRFDPELSDAVLRDPDRRARLVAETVDAVERVAADGVNVDFEHLHEETAPFLTAFTQELSAALGDRTVSVDVPPRTATWEVEEWSAGFEYRELSHAADYLVVMAYDQHDAARPGGPVADLAWTREVVEHLLRSADPEKVILGVPFYSREWVQMPDGAELVETRGMAEMRRHLDQQGAESVFEPSTGLNRHSYTDEHGRTHRVWLEDTASLRRRAEVATTYNLAGVAAWRAGLEPPAAWRAIDQALAAEPRPAEPASGPPRLNPLVPAPRLAEPPPAAPPTEDAGTGREPRRVPIGGGASLPAAPLAVGVLALVVVASLYARLRSTPDGSGTSRAPR